VRVKRRWRCRDAYRKRHHTRTSVAKVTPAGYSRYTQYVKVLVGKLTIDDQSLVITLDGRTLAAPPKVVELILALAEQHGEVLSKEALMERLWPQGYADDATLWQTIYLARKVLAKTGAATIETQPRRGYRIVPLVTPSPSTSLGINSAAQPRSRGAVYAAVAAIAVMSILLSIGIFAAVHRSAPAPMSAATYHAYNLGRLYVHQGTFVSERRAMTELQSVVRDAPADARGYANLAEAEALYIQNMMNGRHAMVARATEHANTALQIDPKSATAQTALAVAAFYDHAPPAQVDTLFKRAIALDNNDAISHMNYGYFLFTRGDLHGAYSNLHSATDIDPSLGDANILLAKVAYKLGDSKTAIHYVHEGLSFGAEDKFDAYQTLGYAYAAMGQPQSALHAFRQLHDYDPQTSEAGVTYVRALLKGSALAGM
jgi:DNA-binding winged helix-turn-helix (wHTH) protein/Flp pilus assembly protein TadD